MVDKGAAPVKIENIRVPANFILSNTNFRYYSYYDNAVVESRYNRNQKPTESWSKTLNSWCYNLI